MSQSSDTVHQILVFPNAKVKELFEAEMEARKNRYQYNLAMLSSCNAGAIYNLLAVKFGKKEEWFAMIICGIHGNVLAEDNNAYTSSDMALHAAYSLFMTKINNSSAAFSEAMKDK